MLGPETLKPRGNDKTEVKMVEKVIYRTVSHTKYIFPVDWLFLSFLRDTKI